MVETRWTRDEEHIVARMWLRDGARLIDIAAKLGRTKSSVFRRIKLRGWKGQKSSLSKWEEWKEVSGQMPSIRPVRIEISSLPPSPKPHTDSDHYVSLHWSDVHFPFQDPRCVNILYEVAQDISPAALYMHGDLLDFWQLTDFRPPSDKRITPDEADLQHTLELGAEHLAIMGSLCSTGSLNIQWGNHEDRLDRFLAAARSNPKLHHLLSVKAISDAFDLSWLLGLGDLGWTVNDYQEDGTLVLHDRLVLAHGDRANKWATRSYLDKYGKSVIFGHDHRIQNFTRRDLRGTDSAWGMGCLCRLDPHYMSFPNWHNGFAVVEWIKTAKDGWLFDVHQVRIHDGVAVFRGKAYKG